MINKVVWSVVVITLLFFLILAILNTNEIYSKIGSYCSSNEQCNYGSKCDKKIRECIAINSKSGYDKNIIRAKVRNTSTKQEQLHQENANENKDIWDLSPSDLINLQGLELDLESHGEYMFFNAIEAVPRQSGFFYGEVDGGGMTVNLLSTEENGIYGSMIDTHNNKIYQFQPNSNGDMQIIRKSVAEFNDYDEWTKARPSPLKKLSDERQRIGFNQFEGQSNDRGDTIDVMVVWTKSAECRNSGLLEDCTPTDITTSNMLGKIQLAIGETNTAFALSGINTKLRLVHAYLDSTYQESDLMTALEDITYSNDNKLDEVHKQRAIYGADAVSIWIDSEGCGMGWEGPYEEYMFSAVNWSCATGYFSFGHEIAHNMGCSHDRGTEGKCHEDNSLGYGYRDQNAAFRDIMSYNCVSGQCDNNAGVTCSRVQRFSNIYFDYEGLPIGDERNNCAHVINSKLSTIASYFPSKTDKELSDLKADELEKANSPAPTPVHSCRKARSRCNKNVLCCSGNCKFRRCR